MGVWRCAMLTAMQCGTYDRAKEAAGHLLGTSQTDVGTHFAPSLASGIASTTATVPFDNVKTIQIVQRLPTALEGGFVVYPLFGCCSYSHRVKPTATEHTTRLASCSGDQHMSNIEQFIYLGTESNCVIACTQRTDGHIERKQVVPLPNPLGLKHGTPGGVAVEWVTAHPSGAWPYPTLSLSSILTLKL